MCIIIIIITIFLHFTVDKNEFLIKTKLYEYNSTVSQ